MWQKKISEKAHFTMHTKSFQVFFVFSPKKLIAKQIPPKKSLCRVVGAQDVEEIINLQGVDKSHTQRPMYRARIEAHFVCLTLDL